MLCDLAVLLQRFGQKMDWEVLVARARQWKAVRAVYVVLFLSRDMLGAPIPAQTLIALKPQNLDENIVELAREQMLFDRRLQPVDSDMMNITKMTGTASLGKKLSVLQHAFFPPPGMIAREYSVPIDSWRLYLYYPVRIYHIISRTMFEVKRVTGNSSKRQTDRKLLMQLSYMSDWLMSE